MKLLVAGARLQGVEAIYLGHKAGLTVTAIDCDPLAPGASLADCFLAEDLMDWPRIKPYFEAADVILPAVENQDVLNQIKKYSQRIDTPVLFDWNAYAISHSKLKSNTLFETSHLPLPARYPDCDFPVIIKPDGLSGSKQVRLAYTTKEVEAFQADHPGESFVIQEFLEGPSYSLEVVGNGQTSFPLVITEVIVDRHWDCKRIAAPAVLPPEIKTQMTAIAETLSGVLPIDGIFDIEVIDHHGTLKLLEIDARLPSQTPIAVYHATGFNMVSAMITLKQGQPLTLPSGCRSHCLYQQIAVHDGKIDVLGEGIMSRCSGLQIIPHFFGAEEAITNYRPGSLNWQAIVIILGDTPQDAQNHFSDFIHTLKQIPGMENYHYLEG
jgi:pyrrolysine biosynthesis protein PylC